MVVCRSFWPSFMKSYTVDQHNAVNLGLWSRVTPWASWRRGRLGVCQNPANTRLRPDKQMSPRVASLLLELNLRNVMTMRPGRDIRLGKALSSRTHAFAVSWAHDMV